MLYLSPGSQRGGDLFKVGQEDERWIKSLNEYHKANKYVVEIRLKEDIEYCITLN